MRAPTFVRWVAVALAGFVAGAVVTMSVQSPGRSPARRDAGAPAFRVPTAPEAPETFLAWTPGGLPDGFRTAVAKLPGIERSVVVASDNTWMTRSFSADGQVVDDPPKGFAIPLEVGAVDPNAYAPFLPPADRGIVVALEDGQGILGESSARLRGLGPGAVLEFGSTRVQVAAILPDELVGAKELMVSSSVGREIGVTHDRYALLQPNPIPGDRQLAKEIRGILPPGLDVQVRAPGETPYFREGDAVLPPVRVKQLFGEFAAKPTPGQPGYLTIDPAWVKTHIATEHVPLLGTVTCNVATVPAASRRDRPADRRRPFRHDHELLGLLRPPFREPRPDGRDLAPLVGYRRRRQRAAEPVRGDAQPGSADGEGLRGLGLHLGRGLHPPRRDALRVPPAASGRLTSASQPGVGVAGKREGSSEHALSALARAPAGSRLRAPSMPPAAGRAWVSAPFAVTRRPPRMILVLPPNVR